MIEGKTKSGFDFAINDDILDDWELLEALEVLDSNPAKIVTVAKLMLGDDYEKLKEHCTNKRTKRVSTKKMSAEIEEIMVSNNDSKNS